MIAVCYYRYSSNAQTEQSIEGQQKVCKEYAAAHNITIIEEYIDRAQTGTNTKRPAFQRMIKEASTKAFDTILVYKFDRFARNRYDSVLYKKHLKDIGISVVSCMEHVTDDEGGQTVEAIYEVIAEWYSIDLSKKAIRGKIINAEKGHYNGEPLPIGYKVQNKQVVIDEATAHFVPQIFSLYANGMNTTEIIAEMQAQGMTNQKGNLVQRTSIYAVLNNPRYAYPYEFHGITLQYPMLVDPTLYEEVHRLLDMHYHRPGRSNGVYLLSGKLFCGHCKQRMRGKKSPNNNGKSYYYYMCSNHEANNAGCIKKLEQKDNIEDFVLSAIKNILTDPRAHERIVSEIMTTKTDDNNKIKAQEKKLKKLTTEYTKMMDTFLDYSKNGPCDEIGEEIKNDMRQKVYSKKREVKSAEESLIYLKQASKPLVKTEVEKWLTSFVNADRQTLIDKLIHSVYAFNDKIVVYFKSFKDNSKIYNFAIKDRDLKKIEHSTRDDTTNICTHNICSLKCGKSNYITISYKFLIYPYHVAIILYKINKS